jgi:hypothetical protein
VADLAVDPTPLPASNLQVAGRPFCRPAPSAASQQPPSGRPGRWSAPSAASQLPLRSSSTLHCGVYGFPYGSPAVVPCVATAIGESPSRGNLGRRDNTKTNAIQHETRLFRGPTDKDKPIFSFAARYNAKYL